ncbi:MAG: BlaI/MecI/CopY family transcriptional regulator [Fimbriimonadaceae bacterium]|nr:BlaI/MecI/CopY family transcriptional regulator [Fimbriimonadaceae bacterium]
MIRFISERSESTVREMTDGFASSKGVSRGTIVKMVDRLMKKGLLRRQVVDHIFRYSLSKPIENVESDYVQRFVDERLKGHLSPLLGFLSESSSLSTEDRVILQQIAERVKDDQEG